MKSRSMVIALAMLVSLAALPADAQAGDAFLKLGMILHPDVGDIGDRWFVSAGSDWGFHPQGFWGLEFQGAYRSESEEDFKVTTVPANVFLNFKWKSEAQAVRPYAGGGAGLISSYVKTEDFGDSEHEWVKDAGMQFMGGVEFNRKFAVELLGQRAFEEGAEFYWSVLAGIRW